VREAGRGEEEKEQIVGRAEARMTILARHLCSLLEYSGESNKRERGWRCRSECGGNDGRRPLPQPGTPCSRKRNLLKTTAEKKKKRDAE
jgi:hypothetical protein